MYKTIKLKKYVDIINEKVAAAAIVPGMIIELIAAGTVQAHATADGFTMPMVALEDELQGNGIDDAYAALDPVQCWSPVRGEEGYCILADGYSASIGDKLSSNGNGYLRTHTPTNESEYSDSVIAIALEAVDTSGSSGEESSLALGFARRIRVMFV